MLAIHSMRRRGYCGTAVPGTITKPTLSLPLLELNKASPSRCAQDYKPPQTPAGSRHAWPHTVALLLLARIRRTAMTSDKVPQRAKMPPPARCHPQCPRAALWNILRSPVCAHGRDLGLGGHCSHPNTGFFNPALPSLLLFPVLLGTNLGNTGSPQKNLAHCFFCFNFGQTCSLMATREQLGSTGWRLPRPRGSVAQQEAGTEHCCRWNQVEQPITHTQPPFFLFVHTVSVFQIKIHSNHQSQASSNPPAAMSQET